MKEEIEKILKDCTDIDEDNEGNRYSFFENDTAAKDLQKLFLTKQIELLEGITACESFWEEPHIFSAGLDIKIRIKDLESELATL